MSKYPLAAFLILHGVAALVTVAIPTWVTAVLALAAGAGLLIEQVAKK